MGSQNKSNRQSPKGIKRKGLPNDAQRKGSPKPVARRTTPDRTHHRIKGTHYRIKVKICSAMFLYPKEGRFIMVGSRLQEVKPSHNQGQDATTFDWRSN